MARRKSPQGLATHPQLKQIIAAYLDGQNSRQIAAWSKPRVSHTAIYNYAKNVIEPTMGQAEFYKSLLPAKGVPPAELNAKQQTEQAVQLTQNALAGVAVLAIREKRIEFMQDRHDRLNMIMTERADEMKDEVAGGRSGLLARDYKGKDADRAVYKVDTGLLNELREHEKQVAIELGQWQEQAAPGVAIQIVMPSPHTRTGEDEPIKIVNLAMPKR